MRLLNNDITLGEVIPNIAQLLERNVGLYGNKTVYQEKHNGIYEGISWNSLYNNVLNIAFNLQHQFGFAHGDKMVIFSPNRLEMLELELAVMTSGGIAVPIFAFFYQETAELLIKHSDARFLAVAGDIQLSRLSPDLKLDAVFVFDKGTQKKFNQQ